jgi:hypothetical protein
VAIKTQNQNHFVLVCLGSSSVCAFQSFHPDFPDKPVGIRTASPTQMMIALQTAAPQIPSKVYNLMHGSLDGDMVPAV